MYFLESKAQVIRIPPDRLGDNLDTVAVEITRETFEGHFEGDRGIVIMVDDVERQGEGRIVHGDGAVYQNVTFEALMFTPALHEIVDGKVFEILKFGAFIRFGPLDGLLHISQVLDDKIFVDIDNNRLVGKDKNRFLKVGDNARVRIVAVSINEKNPRESKIGLTMRQKSLGKHEWLEEDRNMGGK